MLTEQELLDPRQVEEEEEEAEGVVTSRKTPLTSLESSLPSLHTMTNANLVKIFIVSTCATVNTGWPQRSQYKNKYSAVGRVGVESESLTCDRLAAVADEEEH